MALVDKKLPTDLEGREKNDSVATPDPDLTFDSESVQQISDRKLSWQSATLLLLTEYVRAEPRISSHLTY